jgi:uncharacterized repeat protein (TIGR02543 family)
MVKKVLTKWSLLVFIICIGVFVSCDSEIQNGFTESELGTIFSAYDELMEALDSGDEVPRNSQIGDDVKGSSESLPIVNVNVTVESETYTWNGSLNYGSDGSSTLRVSLSSASLDEDIPIEVEIDKEDEFSSFTINGIDYSADFLEYLNSSPSYSEVIYYSYYDDGTGTLPPIQKKLNGVSIPIAGNIGNLVREGYRFSGWSTTVNSSTGIRYSGGDEYTVDETLILYAAWETIPTYQINYHANGGAQSEAPPSQTKQEGESISIASRPSGMTRPGYSFNGWNTSANGGGDSYSVGSSYSANGDLDLYAQWNKIGYASEDEYPVITGFSVDHSSVDTFDEEHFVHFTVQAYAPVGELISATVHIQKPENASTGSQPYAVASHQKDAPYPSYPDEVGYEGSNTVGTFTLALPTKSLNYQGTWKVNLIQVISSEGSVNSIHRTTTMLYDEIVVEGYDFEILQTSSDATTP